MIAEHPAVEWVGLSWHSILFRSLLLAWFPSISIGILIEYHDAFSIGVGWFGLLVSIPMYWGLVLAPIIVRRGGRVKLNGTWYPLGAVKGMRAVGGVLSSVPQVVLEAEGGEEKVEQLNAFALRWRGVRAVRFQRLCKLLGLNPDGSRPGQPVV